MVESDSLNCDSELLTLSHFSICKSEVNSNNFIDLFKN